MRKALLAAAATMALASATATAQNTTNDNPSNGAAATGKMDSAAKPNSMTANPTLNAPAPTAAPQTATQAVPDQGPSFIQVQSEDMLSSNVVGLDIYNPQNNDIGKIQDIAFDPSKKITAYILSVGGFLGMGTHYVAVRSRFRHGLLRRPEKGMEGDDERHEGAAQIGSRIQIRRPVDGQQKLSGDVIGTERDCSVPLSQTRDTRSWLTKQRTSTTSGS